MQEYTSKGHRSEFIEKAIRKYSDFVKRVKRGDLYRIYNVAKSDHKK
jgi:metal-responsive CopG/Arc/MetJ family transcriptional regulator